MIRYPCEVSLTNVFKDLAVTCFTVFNGPLNMIGYVEKKSYFYSASLAILNIKVYMIYLAYVFYVQITIIHLLCFLQQMERRNKASSIVVIP